MNDAIGGLAWVLIAAVNGLLAARKGHPAGLWMLASMVGGPVVTILVVFALPRAPALPRAFKVQDPASPVIEQRHTVSLRRRD